MRPTGAITGAMLVGDVDTYFTFARITFSAPTGILRFTDYPADSIALNIEGTSQTWDGTRGCDVPSLAYGKIPLADTTIELGNFDDYFSDLHNTHGHLRHLEVSIWHAHFAAATEGIGAIIDKVLVFKGETHRSDAGDLYSFAVGPTAEYKLIPGRRIDTRSFPYLSKQDISFKWGDVQVNVPTSRPSRPGYSSAPQRATTPRTEVVSGGDTAPTRPDPINVGFR